MKQHILVLATTTVFSMTSQGSAICSQLFVTEKFDPRDKVEIALINFAISKHLLKDTLNQNKITQEAIKAYLNTIDPLKLVFLESEYRALAKLSEQELEDIYFEVFKTPSREFFEKLNQQAKERYQDLIQKFLTSGEFRNSILTRVTEISEGSQITSTTTDLELNLRDHIAQRIVDLQKLTAKAGREITPLAALKIATRQMQKVKNELDAIFAPENLRFVIAKAFVSGLDPHSKLLLRAETRMLQEAMESDYGGIGASLEVDQKGYVIESMAASGPAARAGLQLGDVISHVSSNDIRRNLAKKRYWKAMAGNPMDGSHLFFRGLIGSEIHLRVLRNGKTLEFKMRREKIETGSFLITTNIVSTPKGNLAHVKLRSFFSDSAEQLKNEIINLKKATPLSGMILDLRQNGGGSSEAWVKILGLFVKSGPAKTDLRLEGREVFTIPKDNQTVWDGPLVVVTDPASASASEGLSGALQDYGRAIIVGDLQTYGKGTAQSTMYLTGTIAATYTNAMFFTPSGRSPQIDGITSDVILPADKNTNSRFERDYSNAIPKMKIESLLPPGFSLIPNREKVISELNQRSQERRAGNQISNIDEAFEILKDLIEITP